MVRRALLTFSQVNEPEGRGPTSNVGRKRTRETAKSASNRKKDTQHSTSRTLMCYDCGSVEHQRGSSNCNEQSFLSKKIRSKGGYGKLDTEEKEKENHHAGPSQVQAGTQQASGGRGQSFRQGSNPSKRNHH